MFFHTTLAVVCRITNAWGRRAPTFLALFNNKKYLKKALFWNDGDYEDYEETKDALNGQFSAWTIDEPWTTRFALNNFNNEAS